MLLCEKFHSNDKRLFLSLLSLKLIFHTPGHLAKLFCQIIFRVECFLTLGLTFKLDPPSLDQDKLCGRNIASGTQIRMDSEVKINFYKTIKSVAFWNSFERIAVEPCLMIDQPDQFSFALHLLCILLIRWSWYLELSGAFK